MKSAVMLLAAIFLAGCAAPREVRRATPAAPPVAAAPSSDPVWPANAP